MRRAVVLLVVLAISFAWASPADAAAAVRVYYAGPTGKVLQALQLAPELELVATAAEADVLVLNGQAGDLQAISARLSQGAGLLLCLGPDLTSRQVGTLLGARVVLERHDGPLTLVAAPGVDDPLLTGIVWTSAPQVRERFALQGGGLRPLVAGDESGEVVLGMKLASRLFLFTPFLGDANPQLQDWAYFPYLVYHLTMRAAGRIPVSFADYPGSPVPHARERAVLFLSLTGTVLLALGVFWAVRRYSLAHPQALDTLVSDRGHFQAREARSGWEEVGFHRALGGFLFAFVFGLILFVPAIVYRNLILPRYVLPSAQALGIWGRVTQLFNLFWIFFDMGTSSAFIKFFAQYRVQDPRRAIQYGQLYVWWQALSGTVQVVLVTTLAGTLLPRSSYAIYAWSVIIHTLIQVPGFYQVMRHALTALQRFDYAQALDIGLALVFPVIAQPVLVTLMVAWGRAHPALGMATGGLLGLGLAAYAAEMVTLLVGLWLFRRLGYSARLLFLAHFDRAVVLEALRFGAFEMLGSLLWMVGQAAEILITQTRLNNYAEQWGNWTLAQNFVYAYQVVNTLYKNLLSSMSEAISHGRWVLSQYYVAMAYKWGALVSAFLGAVLLAVGDRFSRGVGGAEFSRAAVYAVPLILWGAVQYPSWVGDNVQLAANRPYLRATMIGLEQAIRIVLAFLLVERFQVSALIVAYFVALLTKDVVTYWVSHRACFPLRFYAWQSLVAPLLAGAAHYAVLRWAGAWIWRGDAWSSVLLLVVGVLPSLPLFAFFYGLFGGWDEGTLEELRRAVRLSGFVWPLVWVFWAATALGARLSPLHGRFPVAIRPAAMAEARSLTEERVRL